MKRKRRRKRSGRYRLADVAAGQMWQNGEIEQAVLLIAMEAVAEMQTPIGERWNVGVDLGYKKVQWRVWLSFRREYDERDGFSYVLILACVVYSAEDGFEGSCYAPVTPTPNPSSKSGTV